MSRGTTSDAQLALGDEQALHAGAAAASEQAASPYPGPGAVESESFETEMPGSEGADSAMAVAPTASAAQSRSTAAPRPALSPAQPEQASKSASGPEQSNESAVQPEQSTGSGQGVEPGGSARKSGARKSNPRSRAKTSTVVSGRTTGLDSLGGGDELEMRLARCAFWEGSYARRGIDLERHFASSPLTITDLDLLAIEFNAQLQQIKTIGEAKSGTGKSAPKPLDRALWISGVARLVRADRAELVTGLQVSDRVRATVADLNVTAMSVDDLARRESAADVDAFADVGAHGPTAFARVKQAHTRLKREPELERAYWFLRSEVWFLSPWAAIRRTLGMLHMAARWWTPKLDDADAGALRWLLAEAVSVLSLNLVAVCGVARHSSPQMWAALARERLAEGAVPTHQMRALSEGIDNFVARAVKAAGGQPNPELIGAFLPQPPEWTTAFIEMVTRLAAVPSVALLPRHVDLVVHERLVHRRHVAADSLARIDQAAGRELASARKLIAAFLRGAGVSIEVVDAALTAETQAPTSKL